MNVSFSGTAPAPSAGSQRAALGAPRRAQRQLSLHCVPVLVVSCQFHPRNARRSSWQADGVALFPARSRTVTISTCWSSYSVRCLTKEEICESARGSTCSWSKLHVVDAGANADVDKALSTAASRQSRRKIKPDLEARGRFRPSIEPDLRTGRLRQNDPCRAMGGSVGVAVGLGETGGGR
jgi:hypothetical protein